MYALMAPRPGCVGEVPRPVEPRARERAGALGESQRAELNAGLGGMFVAKAGVVLDDRRSERYPRTGGPPRVVNRCRAASNQIPRNLPGDVIDNAGSHRQPPPGRPRWLVARPKPRLGRKARRADKGRPCAPSAEQGREVEVRGCHGQAAFAGGASATRV